MDSSFYNSSAVTSDDVLANIPVENMPVPADLKRMTVNKNSGETLLHRAARLGHESLCFALSRKTSSYFTVKIKSQVVPDMNRRNGLAVLAPGPIVPINKSVASKSSNNSGKSCGSSGSELPRLD
ncbi:hypothetical protein RRG08_037571 [Elysia crispata]|uniref:Uncharacterized protein n=1 Tax=Elysia crispata TaxID=231223 RepID=A0AAE0Y6H3_9GAST|nr:hypothetical protein RRG08_037571 [Elysia crispata]